MKKRIIAFTLALCTFAVALSACRKIEKAENVDIADYSKYVTLGDYTGLEITVDPADVTDEQLKTKIDSIIKEKTEPEHITDRVVAETDTINMDFSGTIDGTAIENGSATGYDYAIGGNLIPTLNDQLAGLTVGQEYDLNCKFPDDYTNNTELAGKDAVFTVKVNYIHGEDVVPEWTDDFVNSYSSGAYTTVADYEKYLKEQILESNEQTQRDNYLNALWNKVYENCTIEDYPEEKVDEIYELSYNSFVSSAESYASYFGITYEEVLSQYYQTTEDEVKTYYESYAQNEVAALMISCMIAQKEKINLSEDEYQSLASAEIESYSISVEEYESQCGKTLISENYIASKVNDFLSENNKMVIGDASEDETTTAGE